MGPTKYCLNYAELQGQRVKRVHSIHWTKKYIRSESSQKANLMWVLFQVDSTSDRVWDQVVDRVAMLILPCHPSCFLGFFFALGSASVDGLDEGVALARLEDAGA